MKISARTKICMVIGDPVAHSLSPELHNAGYEALDIDNQYVYVACHVAVKDIESFLKGIRVMNIRGISCTMPHKITVMQFLDKIDPVARKIGAVNTILNDNRKLTGYNTDWLGILTPLEKITVLKNKTVAIIGSGGASRAVAYAVKSKGAKLIIFNRTFEKAEEIAQIFGGTAYPIESLEYIRNADIIINTTSVGFEQINKTLVPKKYIRKNQIIFDIVYSHETKLLADGKEKGAQTISGREMFLYQGMAQFLLFTGYEAPEEEMRKIIQ